MDGNPVDKWSWLAANPKGLKRTRRKAALRLAEAGTPLAAMGLARAAANSGDEEVAALALRTFAGAVDQEVIDAVCGVWRNHRDSVLSGLIIEERWLASDPLELRMLTALHTERFDALAEGDAELARLLLHAAEDESPPLHMRARTALAGLTSSDAREVVCESAIRDGDPIALEIATAHDFAEDPRRRTLLLFLAGDFDRLADLDFDGRLLAQVHASADTSLRARLAARARASSRVEWVRAVSGPRGTGGPRHLSDEEWAASVDVLTAAGDRPGLWRLVFQAPPVWASRLLRDLGDRAWRPEEETESVAFDRLVALARDCREFDEDDAATRLAIKRPERTVLRSLALAPDGSAIAEGDFKGDVTWWRLPAGERAAPLRTAADPIISLTFTPGGERLVTGGVDGYTRVWDLRSGVRVATMGNGVNPVVSTALDRDGAVLAVGHHESIVSLEPMSSGTRIGIAWNGSQTIEDLVFSRDGRYLAGRSVHGRVGLWHLTPRVRSGTLSDLHWEPIDRDAAAMAIAPDGSVLVTGGQDGALRLWRLPSRQAAESPPGHDGPVSALTCTPAGLLASGGRDGSIRLSRLASGTAVRHFAAHPGGVTALATSTDGRLLASGGEDGRVRLWHLPSGSHIADVARHRGTVYKVVMSDSGQVVAGTGADGTIRIAFASVPRAAAEPLGRTDLAEAERLRAEHIGAPGVLAWYDLVIALLRHRHRHDIDIASAEPQYGTDIAIGEA